MNATSSPPSSPGQTESHSVDVVGCLQKSEIFREYQKAFQITTGLPLVLRAAGSFQPPLQGSKQINPFCALMAAASKTCAACLQLQERVEHEAIAGTKTLQCFAGLSESVVPIRAGEKIIAYLQTGQVFLRTPNEKNFRAAMQQLAKWNIEADVARFHTAYFQGRVLDKAHYDAILRLLSSFAEHLSLVSNELVIKQTASEPPAVSKARAFIAEHMGEPLSLPMVARASNMSAFYFCKVFKAAVGVTFTEYVARVRVERTRQLLLNPHTRISEAAYEAGFQSLSQFNRVFRRVAGEAPTAYRDHLHGHGAVRESSRSPLAIAA